MKRDFNFDHIGKRLPYTAPDGFLDDMENNVWETVRQEMLPSKPKRHFRLWYSLTGGLVAASMHCLLSSIYCLIIQEVILKMLKRLLPI